MKRARDFVVGDTTSEVVGGTVDGITHGCFFKYKREDGNIKQAEACYTNTDRCFLVVGNERLLTPDEISVGDVLRFSLRNRTGEVVEKVPVLWLAKDEEVWKSRWYYPDDLVKE